MEKTNGKGEEEGYLGGGDGGDVDGSEGASDCWNQTGPGLARHPNRTPEYSRPPTPPRATPSPGALGGSEFVGLNTENSWDWTEPLVAEPLIRHAPTLTLTPLNPKPYTPTPIPWPLNPKTSPLLLPRLYPKPCSPKP